MWGRSSDYSCIGIFRSGIGRKIRSCYSVTSEFVALQNSGLFREGDTCVKCVNWLSPRNADRSLEQRLHPSRTAGSKCNASPAGQAFKVFSARKSVFAQGISDSACGVDLGILMDNGGWCQCRVMWRECSCALAGGRGALPGRAAACQRSSDAVAGSRGALPRPCATLHDGLERWKALFFAAFCCVPLQRAAPGDDDGVCEGDGNSGRPRDAGDGLARTGGGVCAGAGERLFGVRRAAGTV